MHINPFVLSIFVLVISISFSANVFSQVHTSDDEDDEIRILSVRYAVVHNDGG